MNKKRFKNIIEPAKNFTKVSEVYNYLESLDDVNFMASAIAYGFGCTYDNYIEAEVHSALLELVQDKDKTIAEVYDEYREMYAEEESDEDDGDYNPFNGYDGQEPEDIIACAVFDVLDAVDKSKTVKEGFKAFFLDYMVYDRDLDEVVYLLDLDEDDIEDDSDEYFNK
jgi:hypothetical protein